jgi:hypothetical protein
MPFIFSFKVHNIKPAFWAIQTILIIVMSLFLTTSSSGQIITTPNKVIKGKKTGPWSSTVYCDTIDFQGASHIVLRYHGDPEYVLSEGYYMNDLMEGFWKEYWIVSQIENTRTFYKRGPLKSVKEYKGDLLSGLFIENYRDGNMKVIGHYEIYQDNKPDTVVRIPNWTKDPTGNTLKDTIIHRKMNSRPYGRWYYFSTNGQLKE